ncbi:MAG: hypothetical protein Q4D76_15835 [Oscillospiraceae bacterium]|nr:hypothetical protein [Oscillospiraceae bacterium]
MGNAPCGTYIDLIIENGVLIPCIVGDIKADAHTMILMLTPELLCVRVSLL